MATTVIYTNSYNEIIVEQQLSSLKDYNKVYKLNGVIKKIESYYNGQFDRVEYFKEDNETLNDIFTLAGTNSLLITQIELIGNYKIVNSFSYIEGVNTHIEKHLLLNNKIICIHEQQTAGQLYCEKYLFDSDESEIGEEIFSFKYNVDGTLKNISGIGYPFSNDNQTMDADKIPLYFPNLLIDNPYYANATFLP